MTTDDGEPTARVYCPDCGWWTKNWDRDDWFHAPDCPVEKLWEAVRPATCPCCGEPTTDVVDTGPGGTIFTMFSLDPCLGLAARAMIRTCGWPSAG